MEYLIHGTSWVSLENIVLKEKTQALYSLYVKQSK